MACVIGNELKEGEDRKNEAAARRARPKHAIKTWNGNRRAAPSTNPKGRRRKPTKRGAALPPICGSIASTTQCLPQKGQSPPRRPKRRGACRGGRCFCCHHHERASGRCQPAAGAPPRPSSHQKGQPRLPTPRLWSRGLTSASRGLRPAGSCAPQQSPRRPS